MNIYCHFQFHCLILSNGDWLPGPLKESEFCKASKSDETSFIIKYLELERWLHDSLSGFWCDLFLYFLLPEMLMKNKGRLTKPLAVQFIFQLHCSWPTNWQHALYFYSMENNFEMMREGTDSICNLHYSSFSNVRGNISFCEWIYWKGFVQTEMDIFLSFIHQNSCFVIDCLRYF